MSEPIHHGLAVRGASVCRIARGSLKIRPTRSGLEIATLLVFLIAAFFGAGCRDRETEVGGSTGTTASCDTAAARILVAQFGDRLDEVSLMAPDSVVARQIRTAYGPLVTGELLQQWMRDPTLAPGRTTSSPWPDRIETLEVTPRSGRGCAVRGEVLWVTSTEQSADSAAARTRISIVLTEGASPRIARVTFHDRAAPSALEDPDPNDDTPSDAVGTGRPERDGPDAVETPEQAPEPTTADAVAVVRTFHDHARAGRFREAYALWEVEEGAEEPPFEEFAAALATIESLQIDLGEPGRVEGAAGSRYVQIPADIRGTADGEAQHLAVTYTLRRSVVDGATPAQRSWRIYTANLEMLE